MVSLPRLARGGLTSARCARDHGESGGAHPPAGRSSRQQRQQASSAGVIRRHDFVASPACGSGSTPHSRSAARSSHSSGSRSSTRVRGSLAHHGSPPAMAPAASRIVAVLAANSSRVPSLSITASARAHFSASGICAAIRFSASSALKPSRARSLSSWVASATATTSVVQQSQWSDVSKRSGASIRTAASPPKSAAASSARSCISIGRWVAALRARRFSRSENAILPTSVRLSSPLGRSAPSPNAATMSV
mmetsp:Transcript_236/g.811  ORF Transcript_236/g.811 Transcript_236/m.811 type:complete len:250 (-) Transcript_236:173-922(-)